MIVINLEVGLKFRKITRESAITKKLQLVGGAGSSSNATYSAAGHAATLDSGKSIVPSTGGGPAGHAVTPFDGMARRSDGSEISSPGEVDLSGNL